MVTYLSPNSGEAVKIERVQHKPEMDIVCFQSKINFNFERKCFRFAYCLQPLGVIQTMAINGHLLGSGAALYTSL